LKRFLNAFLRLLKLSSVRLILQGNDRVMLQWTHVLLSQSVPLTAKFFANWQPDLSLIIIIIIVIIVIVVIKLLLYPADTYCDLL